MVIDIMDNKSGFPKNVQNDINMHSQIHIII